MLKKPLDELIVETNRLFKQFLLAHTALSFGQRTLSGFQDSVCIETAVGLNVAMEPIPMAELRHYQDGLGHFLLEVFHGKTVQVWNECLSKLFELLVTMHFSGKRQFSELKKVNLSLDFRATGPLGDQVKSLLCKEFDFRNYSERVKLLNGLLNPAQEQGDHLSNISKHVQIRNSFQHRGGVVDDFMLKELGVRQVNLLSDDGTPTTYHLNQSILLTVPEFDTLRKSLLMLGQVWRKWRV